MSATFQDATILKEISFFSELLEKELNTQKKYIVETENRIAEQVQSTSASLESRIQDIEDQAEEESKARTNEDYMLRLSVDANTDAIANETEARTASDNALQQQIQMNTSSVDSMASDVSSLQASWKEHLDTVNQEYTEMMDSLADMQSTVQDTKSELEEKVTELQDSVSSLTARTDSIDSAISADNEARDEMDSIARSNAESITDINQKISDIDSELGLMNERFLDEIAVSDMISKSYQEDFAAQAQGVLDSLKENQDVRKADLASIQNYLTEAKNTCLQFQEALNEYKSAMQNASTDIRSTFNLLLPKGTILPYAGDTLGIPDGWAICNGANGTPDLAEKILVGTHAVSDIESGFAIGEGSTILSTGDVPIDDEVDFDNNEDHDDVQTYYVYYIMKMF